ncbi:MAG: hypothetical protein ACRD26_24270 [Vicinamibacterales bacterium]
MLRRALPPLSTRRSAVRGVVSPIARALTFPAPWNLQLAAHIHAHRTD